MLLVCVFASALGGLILCLLALRDGFSPASADAPRADHDVRISRVGHAVAGACFATTAILAIVLVARTPMRPVAAAPDARVTERLTALDHDRVALGEQLGVLEGALQALREQFGTVGGELRSMRVRVDKAESRVATAESGLATTEAGLRRLGDDLAQTSARTRQIERSIATRPVAATPRESVPVPAAPREIVVPAPAPAPPRRTEVERPTQSAPPITQAPVPTPTTQAAVPAPTTQAVVPAPVTAPPAPVVSATPKPAPKPAPSAAASAPRETPSMGFVERLRSDWKVIRKGFQNAPEDFASAVRDFGRRANGGD